MRKMFRVVIFVLLALTLVGEIAFAQPPRSQAPVVPTNPSAATPATPGTTTPPITVISDCKITSVTPTTVISSPLNPVEKTLVFKGTDCQALTAADVVLVSGAAGNLTIAASKVEITAHQVKATFGFPADDEDTYTLAVLGTAVDTVKVRVIDTESYHASLAYRWSSEARTTNVAQQKTIDTLAAQMKAQQSELAAVKASMLTTAQVDAKLKPVLEQQATLGKLLQASADAIAKAQDRVTSLETRTATLETDTGVLAANSPKRGGFLGIGKKTPTEVSAIVNRRAAAIEAARAAANAEAVKNGRTK